MRCRLLGFVMLLVLGFAPLGAADLAPPFGLSWGSSPARLVDWSRSLKLDLLVKAPGNDPNMSVLLVSSESGTLPNHEATMLEARFMKGKLFEVVVHYTYPGRPAADVQDSFLEMKKLLSLKHGKFGLSGVQNGVLKDGISTKSYAYHLKPAPGCLLMLAQTEVTDDKRGDVAARFSVVYHNDKILRLQREALNAARLEPEPLRLPERK